MEKWNKVVVDSWVRVPRSMVSTTLVDFMRVKIDGEEINLYEYDEETGELRIPRAMWKTMAKTLPLMDETVPIMDERSSVGLTTNVSQFIPRKGQAEAVEEVVAKISGVGGGILVAPCGSGKTILAVEVVLRLGVTACILVHKEFLAKQWEEAFAMLCPEIKVGRCQRDRCDTGFEYDVVVVMVQSLVASKREYSERFFNSFGILILDEIHRYGSEVWKNAIGMFPAKYRLGLTATPTRRDGFWPLMEAHIGPVLTRVKSDELIPQVFKVTTNAFVDPEVYEYKWLDTNGQRAKLVTALTKDSGRNAIVARITARAYGKGRKILVISERRMQLNDLCKLLIVGGGGRAAIPEEDIGFYVGGTLQKNLDKAAEKDILLATYSMAGEGLDIPDLDTLIMASPHYAIQQTVGRILRQAVNFEGKAIPVVVDMVDELIPRLNGMWFGRLKQYRKLGYEVSEE